MRAARVRPLPLVGLCLVAAACSTLEIVGGFNQSPHGTIGNPSESHRASAARHVARAIRESLIGAYFESGTGSEVDKWLVAAPRYFREQVACSRAVVDTRCPAKRTQEPGTTMDPQQVQERLDELERQRAQRPWNPTDTDAEAMLCVGEELSSGAQLLADRIRFKIGFEAAAASVARWLDEGLIDETSLSEGQNHGFGEVRNYLAARRWKRDPRRPTLGLVVSGGSSNGMFSAGAVWMLLGLVQSCVHERRCRPGIDPRIEVVSGTSAGAMIATAVDLFNAEEEASAALHAAGRDPPPASPVGLRRLAGWFTCIPANQLYCVDRDLTLSLFGDRVGLVQFDGIRKLLHENVNDEMRKNRSELLLNTVDFRTGELLAPSDQNPLDTAGCADVVNAALASIPLPLMAEPQRQLRTPHQGQLREGFYLDGGVRSQLPITPLAFRRIERVVAVSSNASVISGAPPPSDAVTLLDRYTSIAAGHTAEDGVAFARAWVELRRAEEERLCLAARRCAPDDARCRAFCDGRVHETCDAVPPEATSREASWRLEEIYRDEVRVDSAAGYSFAPRESLPLFLAGMAAVRRRCLEVARFLEILPKPGTIIDPAHQVTEAEVIRWCNAPMPTRKICEDKSLAWPFWERDARLETEVRQCNDSDTKKSQAARCK